MIDSAVAGSSAGNMGWLRSLPFLFNRGISKFTFAKSWLEYGSSVTFDAVLDGDESSFKYTAVPDFQFKYHLLEADTPWRDLEFQHVCQFVSQETEKMGKSSTTQKLLRAYNEDLIEELFLVVDTPNFRLSNQESDKPLTENLTDVGEFGYKGASKYYLKHELPTTYLSLNDTLNIWLHEAAVEYANTMNKPPSRIADLFDFAELDTTVRTWDFFEFLASNITEQETDHIQATVRPWVECDISRIKKYILNDLQRFDFDAEQVKRYRRNN
jgi:hypothetical protein